MFRSVRNTKRKQKLLEDKLRHTGIFMDEEATRKEIAEMAAQTTALVNEQQRLDILAYNVTTNATVQALVLNAPLLQHNCAEEFMQGHPSSAFCSE